MWAFLTFIWFLKLSFCAGISSDNNITYRLAGSNFSNEGVVEVFYKGTWGRICSNWWDLNDAKVLCRSLRLPPPTFALTRNEFGTVRNRTMWMSRVQCSGKETSLTECPHAGWGNVDRCYYPAGVVCGHPTVHKISITDLSGVITSPGYPHSMTQAHYEWTFRPPIPNAMVLLCFEKVDLYRYHYYEGQTFMTLLDATKKQLAHFSKNMYNASEPISFFIQNIPVKMVYFSSFTVKRNVGKGIFGRYLITDRIFNEAPLKESWNIAVVSNGSRRIDVSWSPFNIDVNSWTTGYAVTCNSTEGLQNMTYAIANNRSRSASLYSLMEYTYYRVQVLAVIVKDDGSTMMYGSTIVTTRTAEGVPSQSPQNITATPLGPQEFLIKWDPIPREHVHGVLLGYKVVYQDGDSYREKSVTTNDTNVVLKDLLPAMQYYLYVVGFTAKGLGRRKHYVFRTKCGRDIKDETEGRITSTYVRNRRQVVDCEWNFQTSSKNGVIMVIFDFVELPLSSLCRTNYVALYDGQGQLHEKFCGRRRSFSFTTIGSAKIHLYSEIRRQSGTLMNARYYMYNISLHNFPVAQGWNVTAAAQSSTSMYVTWPSFPITNTNGSSRVRVAKYMVVCIAVNDKTNISTVMVDSYTRNAVVANLGKFTEYTIQVLAFLGGPSGNASFLAWSNDTVKGSEQVITKTYDDVPSQPPQNILTKTTSSHSILVSWQHIPSKFVHGILLGYRVYYRVAYWSSVGNASMIEATANTTSVHLEGLLFHTQYRVEIAGVTRRGIGPRSRAVFAKTGCSQKLKGVYGTFSSPNYPSNYPSNTDCTWTIGKELSVHQVFIVYKEFNTENGPSCSNDYVKVADEKDNMVGLYCGRKSPFAASVLTRSAKVIIHSDGGFEEKGFTASYFVMDGNSKALPLQVKSQAQTQVVLSSKDLAFLEVFVVHREAENNSVWNVANASLMTNIVLNQLLPSRQYEAKVIGYNNGSVYRSDLLRFKTEEVPKTDPPEVTSSPSPTTREPMRLMYDYGTSEGDSLLSTTYSRRCFSVVANDEGILIFNKRHYKLYICRNGLIRFGSPWYAHWPYPFGSRPKYADLNSAMLAPYWAAINPYYTLNFEVYYQLYSSSDNNVKSTQVLDRATSDVNRLVHNLPTTFKATWVLVVTWHRIRQFSFIGSSHNTFQAVIITDGVYTFVMYNYPPNGIQWSAPTSRNNYRRFWNSRGLPVVGWSAGREHFYNVPRSGTVKIESIDSEKGSKVFVTRRVPKAYSHGVVGKWFFRLETSTGSLKAEQQCKRWFKKQPDPRPFVEYLEPCPCTFRQAFWDERFTAESNLWWKSEQCAYSTFPSVDGWEQKCCYSKDWRSRGALIVGHPGGGTPHRYSRFRYGDHFQSDIQGHKWCCVQSSLCHLYYQKRPSGDCSQYEPPELSWMWGDPHFVTLDGKNYTFNGLGEYVMLDAKDSFFQVQARTRLAKGDGTATVFCAVVAQEKNTSKVQLNLEKEGNMTLSVDGKNKDYYSLTNQSTRLNGSVVVSRPKDNVFRATFPSGISVTVTEVKGALSILLAMPKSFRNKTKGLLGTWNGDQTDDLTTPNGDVLPANASSKDIHLKFGQKWQVNENTSLFTYQFGENVSTYSNTSFVPMFIEDLKFYNESLKQQAHAACQGDINCLFDSASTKDVSVGLSTKIVGSQMVNESNTLKNSPPVFQNDSVTHIYAKVNTTRLVTFVAKDPDGDTMEFFVTGLPEDSVIKKGDSAVNVTWNITMDPVELEVIVKDSKGAASVLRPSLYICACHNSESCLPNNQEEADRNNSRFSIMSCQCPSGYTGRFCESDIDACEVNMNPCYPGVQCKDLPAPANVTGYECGPCPPGFTGQGDSCSDINECDGSSQGCSHNCANTPGSFTCYCRQGYLLNRDGRTCDDVNECDPASDCMQGCVNTPGSYRCTCDKYFTVDPANPKRCIPESPCKDGNHQCQHICYVSNGAHHCACPSGYELQNDGKTCSDVDECQTGKNRCNQLCRNTIGWYECACVSGFRLDVDNVTCVDIDECMEWTFNCSASLRCENTYGSYKCQCEEGMYLIEGRCRELDEGEKTPKPPLPPPAPIPSETDLRNAINITISGLNISEWNKPVDLDFKKTVAFETTEFCAKTKACLSKNTRSRRSYDYILFTSDQVHLLPGYPLQLPYSSISGHMIAAVAFYVKFPSGVAIGVTDTVDKVLLVDIVNGSLARISRAINKTILYVSVHMDEKPTDQPTTNYSSPTDTTGHKEKPGYVLYLIIGGSVVGTLLIIMIIAVIIRKSREDSPASIKKEVGMEMQMQYGDFESLDNL